MRIVLGHEQCSLSCGGSDEEITLPLSVGHAAARAHVRVKGEHYDYCLHCGDEMPALAAGTRSAETNEDLAQSEGCQSGPKGNAQDKSA